VEEARSRFSLLVGFDMRADIRPRIEHLLAQDEFLSHFGHIVTDFMDK
jgi:hypothetical protein